VDFLHQFFDQTVPKKDRRTVFDGRFPHDRPDGTIQTGLFAESSSREDSLDLIRRAYPAGSSDFIPFVAQVNSCDHSRSFSP
jgi:hypothetical protein